jgi:hypothetical protein
MSISMIRAQNPQGVVTDGYMLSLKANDLDELIGDQVRALRELEGNWARRRRPTPHAHVRTATFSVSTAVTKSLPRWPPRCSQVRVPW